MKSSDEPAARYAQRHASGVRAVLTVLIGLVLEIAVALALSALSDHAQAAPAATEAFPNAARHTGSPQALRVRLGGPGVPARTWLVSSPTRRDRGLVVLREEGTSRSQQVTVQKPASGGQVEVSVRRATRVAVGYSAGHRVAWPAWCA